MDIKIGHEDKQFIMSSKYDEDLMIKIWDITKTFYELKLLDKIKEISSKGVFIDLGANLGNHSVFFMNYCPCTKLYAVEACAETSGYLKKNLENNNPDNIEYEIITKAVSDKSGYVTMSDVEPGNTGLTRIVDEVEGKTQSATIDELFSDVKNISVIKLDIEGFEYFALQEADKVLKNNNAIIIAEIHKTEEVNYESMCKILEKYGYKSDRINYATTPTFIWIKE